MVHVSVFRELGLMQLHSTAAVPCKGCALSLYNLPTAPRTPFPRHTCTKHTCYTAHFTSWILYLGCIVQFQAVLLMWIATYQKKIPSIQHWNASQWRWKLMWTAVRICTNASACALVVQSLASTGLCTSLTHGSCKTSFCTGREALPTDLFSYRDHDGLFARHMDIHLWVHDLKQQLLYIRHICTFIERGFMFVETASVPARQKTYGR
jgi:hypothetical protein